MRNLLHHHARNSARVVSADLRARDPICPTLKVSYAYRFDTVLAFRYRVSVRKNATVKDELRIALSLV
jgi:hypothetical protein